MLPVHAVASARVQKIATSLPPTTHRNGFFMMLFSGIGLTARNHDRRMQRGEALTGTARSRRLLLTKLKASAATMAPGRRIAACPDAGRVTAPLTGFGV